MGICDEDEFKLLGDALDQLNFSDDDQDGMFAVVAGLLQLSNCTLHDVSVNGGEGSEVVEGEAREALQFAAENFGVEEQKLSDSITLRRLVVGKDVTFAPQDAKKATTMRAVLAKLFYGKMFKWIVKRLNMTLETEGDGGEENNCYAGDGGGWR
jgi:myosin heavy subunit